MLLPGVNEEGGGPGQAGGGPRAGWERPTSLTSCVLQILKPADKNKGKYGQFSGLNPGGRPITPPRNSAKAKK